MTVVRDLAAGLQVVRILLEANAQQTNSMEGASPLVIAAQVWPCRPVHGLEGSGG